MGRLREVFTLELRALVRSHALTLLCAASVGWMLLLPHFLLRMQRRLQIHGAELLEL